MAKSKEAASIPYTSLMAKLVKATTLDYSDILEDSEVFNNIDVIGTSVPMINVGLSGSIGGGLTAGLTVIAGFSRHFKSAFALVDAAAYLKKYDDAVCIFYDSEFGSPKKYFESVGIDPKRVLHVPVTTLEDLRSQMAQHLKEINRGDHIILVVDSVGNLASNKEVKDAEDGSEKADLSRARVIKSMFRIVTPHLKLKNIPMVAVLHIYETMELYAKKVISGGQGVLLSADTAWIISRQVERDSVDKAEIVGFDFVINIEKSRYIKEKSKIPITVSFKGGIMKWSGLFDLAREAGILVGTKSYQLATEPDSPTYSRKELENNGEFWKKVLQETALADFIENKYALPKTSLISDDVDAPSLEDLTADEDLLTEEASS